MIKTLRLMKKKKLQMEKEYVIINPKTYEA